MSWMNKEDGAPAYRQPWSDTVNQSTGLPPQQSGGSTGPMAKFKEPQFEDERAITLEDTILESYPAELADNQDHHEHHTSSGSYYQQRIGCTLLMLAGGYLLYKRGYNSGRGRR